jgi:hypothetical protein
MTLAEFSQVYAVLALQLNDTHADEMKIRSYYQVLGDLELEFVALAAERIAQTAEWFPKTSEWRATARTVEHERADQLRARLRQRPTPLCLACDDTGWSAHPGTTRFRPCDCRQLRRLEVLGRRPMPALPDPGEEPAPNPAQFERVRAMITPLVEAKTVEAK